MFAPQKATADDMKESAQKDFGDKADEFLKLYPIDTPEQVRRSALDYAGDRFIAMSTWEWIEAQTKTGKRPVYHYRFDMMPAPKNSNAPCLGAYHSAEIEYVFGQFDAKTDVAGRKKTATSA